MIEDWGPLSTVPRSKGQCPLTVKVAMISLGVQGLTSVHGYGLLLAGASSSDMLYLCFVQSALAWPPGFFQKPFTIHQVLLSTTLICRVRCELCNIICHLTCGRCEARAFICTWQFNHLVFALWQIWIMCICTWQFNFCSQWARNKYIHCLGVAALFLIHIKDCV